MHPLRLYNIPVNALSLFTNNINFGDVLKKIEQRVPERLTNNVDVIYIADLPDFRSKSFNALYKDGAIYISPDQDNEADLLDDIIHEIAHSLEREHQNLIYGDGNLEREFLGKRRTLYYLLDNPTLGMLDYNNADYTAKFDDHMYNDIGYDNLRMITSGLFYSPYAITSLREYWANGFENYLLGDRAKLKDLSPVLYNKVDELIENNEDY